MLLGGNEETRKIDEYAINTLGIPGIVLMENAAASFVKNLDLTADSYLVICGKGNNGGDGYAIARQLNALGKNITVFCIDNQNMSKDCKINYEICKNMNIKISSDIDELDELLINSRGVIDGIFGTGLNSPVTGIYREVIEKINRHSQHCKIYSVDIPSGINGNTGEIMGTAVKAFKTVSFVIYKKGFLNRKNKEYFGEIRVENIGVNENSFLHLIKDHYLTEKEIQKIIIGRNEFSHKEDFGKILIFAGSKGFSGAAKITVNSCVRSGSGLVTLLTYNNILNEVSSKMTEAMTLGINSDFIEENFPEIEKMILNSDVMAIGPGIGKSEKSLVILEKLLSFKKNIKGNDIKLVIDADGLNLLSENKYLFKEIENRAVLTPHSVEFSRLSGFSLEEIEKYRFEICRDFALSNKVILLLKGKNTLITDGNEVYINSTGNPYMANGGAGDCLTGIIASLSGQNYELFESAYTGAFLHGYIADGLFKEQYIINASHIIENIPKYMKKLFCGK